MNSTLKIVVLMGLLLGGVFALTYFSQYTPTGEGEQSGISEVDTSKKPLQFFSSRRSWVPREVYEQTAGSVSLADVAFPGYYEPGVEHNSASFWFENRNTEPVRIQLKSVSCSTCSGGRIASIPPEVAKQILQMTAIGTLPQGLVSGLPLGLVAPAAQLDPARLNWSYHKFDKAPADITYEVPGAPAGAADKWATEQWAILELQFQAKPNPGAHSLTADFITQLQGAKETFEEKFGIIYVTVNAFELDKTSIDVGELTDASASQTHEVLIYSSTRKSLQGLDVSVTMPVGVAGEPGPFVSVGKPQPVPPSRFFQLMESLTRAKQQPVRLLSAFTVPITISPKVGDAKMDIGRLDRNVNFGLGSETIPVRVVGSMRGPIYLSGSREISFGFFNYVDPQTVTVTVETERANLDLRIVPELTQPKAMKLELQRQPDIGERGIYKLKASLPAKEQLGEIKDGVVVLEAKGPNPLRLRIPVAGRGR